MAAAAGSAAGSSKGAASGKSAAAAAAAAGEPGAEDYSDVIALLQAIQESMATKQQLDNLVSTVTAIGAKQDEQAVLLDTVVERLDGLEGRVGAVEGQSAQHRESIFTLERLAQFRSSSISARMVPLKECTVLAETDEEHAAQVLLSRAATASVVSAVLQEQLGVPAGMFSYRSCRRVGPVKTGADGTRLPRPICFEVGSAQQLQDLMRHLGSAEFKAKQTALKLRVVEYLSDEEFAIRNLISNSAEWQQAKAAAGDRQAGFRRAVPYVNGQMWEPAKALLRTLTGAPGWLQRGRAAARARPAGAGGGGGAGGAGGGGGGAN
jgi:hypothetical protein